jgi:hypothetical protein
MVLFI